MNKTLSIINFLAFIGVVTVNALANILPVNGYNTGQVSAFYENLFVPAGFTFSIWGVIYLLLFAFSIFQLVSAFKDRYGEVNQKIGLMYLISSIANITWIYLWHHLQIGTSLFVMLVILSSLFLIYYRLRIGVEKQSRAVKWFVHVPFSIYLGWISVATVANVSAFLVDAEWGGFGINPAIWAIIMVAVATALGGFVLLSRNDPFYALVIVWALFGIWANRFSEEPSANSLTGFVGLCLLFLLALIITRLAKRKHYLAKKYL